MYYYSGDQFMGMDYVLCILPILYYIYIYIYIYSPSHHKCPESSGCDLIINNLIMVLGTQLKLKALLYNTIWCF